MNKLFLNYFKKKKRNNSFNLYNTDATNQSFKIAVKENFRNNKNKTKQNDT